MVDDIVHQTDIDEVPFSLIQKLSRTPKAKVGDLLSSYR